MKHMDLDIPTFAFVVGTRAALAGGVGLLLSERLTPARRRAIGSMLLAIGAATTIPAALWILRSLRGSKRNQVTPRVEYDERLIGATRFPRRGDDELTG